MNRCSGVCRGAVLLGLAAFLVGCGGGGGDQYGVQPVSGVVTCQGKPVANATVNFTPVKEEGRAEGRPGRVALGITDENGKFRLTTYENYDGAIVGRHTVTVGLNSANEDDQSDPNKGFPCANATLELEVFQGVEEVNVDFK